MADPNLNSIFTARGFDAPATLDTTPPMIGNGLVVAVDDETKVDPEQRFTSALAALLYNVEPVVDEKTDGAVRFDKGQVAEAIALIDERIKQQLDAILHTKKFQEMEAVWRGLEDLVTNTNFKANITIELLDVEKKELAQDFENNSSDIFSSALFEKVYIHEYDQYGGRPFGAMIGLYEFESTPADIKWLDLMGRVANAAHCPFISAASFKFFDDKFERIEDLAAIKNLDAVLSHPRYGKWNELRDKEWAAYIGLTLPRYILRLPYNTSSNPCEVVKYDEEAKGNPDNYLWGNAAILMARNLVKAFEISGWCQSIRGPKGGGQIKGLPVDAFELRGQKMIQPPVELIIPDYREYEFARNGFIPLVYRKNEAEATFFSTQSIKRTKRFKDPKDSENSQLVANLAYSFSITRIAHYVKCIMRDNIGSTADDVYVQQQISSWLAGYVTTVVNPDDLTLRRFPFKATNVAVARRPGEIGWYDCRIAVLPHIQFEGLNVELMLESRLG